MLPRFSASLTAAPLSHQLLTLRPPFVQYSVCPPRLTCSSFLWMFSDVSPNNFSLRLCRNTHSTHDTCSIQYWSGLEWTGLDWFSAQCVNRVQARVLSVGVCFCSRLTTSDRMMAFSFSISALSSRISFTLESCGTTRGGAVAVCAHRSNIFTFKTI